MPDRGAPTDAWPSQEPGVAGPSNRAEGAAVISSEMRIVSAGRDRDAYPPLLQLADDSDSSARPAATPPGSRRTASRCATWSGWISSWDHVRYWRRSMKATSRRSQSSNGLA